MLSMNEARDELSKLIEGFKGGMNLNEAQTRFHLIDVIISKCLGWAGEIDVEKYERENGFTDYELGKPRKLIIEAKREDEHFEIPAGLSKTSKMQLKSLLQANQGLKEAILQAQKYCASRGVPLAVITNGHQFVAFLASRIDGMSIDDGEALVFSSLEHLYTNFTLAWNNLSKDGVAENRLYRYLTTGDKRLPPKLSSHLTDYPCIRYASDVQASLKQLSELFLQDVIDNPELEKSFYEKCYCESGALNKYALLSKNILEARYAAIFSSSEKQPTVQPVNSKKGITLRLKLWLKHCLVALLF